MATNNTHHDDFSVLDRLHDQLPHHNQVLVVKMCLGVFHRSTLQSKIKMPGDTSKEIFRNRTENEDDVDDIKKQDSEYSEKYNSRKLSTDSNDKAQFGNESISPKKKKIPISETFYARHSPQVIGRKVYCPSPFKGLTPSGSSSPFPSVMNRFITEAEPFAKKEKKKSQQPIRDVNSTVDQSLITKFRLIFLGVTKNDYMKQIHSGRLPR
jgi:hypothetical protein